MARYGRQGPAGMGGWLAFFVATLVLNAISGLAAWYGVLQLPVAPGAHRYIVAMAVIGALRSVICGGLAWALIRRRRIATIRLVITGLWVLAVSAPLTQLIARAFLLDRPEIVSASMLRGALLAPTLYAAIWTAYLLRSERVANTYAPPDDQLAAVFG